MLWAVLSFYFHGRKIEMNDYWFYKERLSLKMILFMVSVIYNKRFLLNSWQGNGCYVSQCFIVSLLGLHGILILYKVSGFDILS